jgi:hypothetical protein
MEPPSVAAISSAIAAAILAAAVLDKAGAQPAAQLGRPRAP